MPGFKSLCRLLLDGTWSLINFDFFTILFSNVRAMLMIPLYEQPIDTTESIFKHDKIPLVNLEGSFWKEYLMESPNYWERRAGIWDFYYNRI